VVVVVVVVVEVILHSWSSKGNQLMSILHVLRNIPGGTHRQLPSDDTVSRYYYNNCYNNDYT